jgi:hypothetical protein
MRRKSCYCTYCGGFTKINKPEIYNTDDSDDEYSKLSNDTHLSLHKLYVPG